MDNRDWRLYYFGQDNIERETTKVVSAPKSGVWTFFKKVMFNTPD
jgi:hypothetical protein